MNRDGKLSVILAASLLAAGLGACGSADSATTPGFSEIGPSGGSSGGGGDAATGGTGGSVAKGGTGGTSGGGTGGQGGTGGTGPELLGAPYPIVLSHGFFGFEEFAGVGFATYFYQVKEHLEDHGETHVFTPAVDPYNNSTARGELLIAHIEKILEETGHAKVNIVGHSQGGLDARMVASTRPDLVASVMTVATPHLGTEIADAVVGIIPGPISEEIVDWLVKLVAAPLWDEAGNETSLMEAMRLFSTPGIAEFNELYPDSAGVGYYSITGRSGNHRGGEDCEPDIDVSFVSDFADERDPIDALLSIPEALLDGSVITGDSIFDDFPNDGLVRAKNSQWGTFLGCVPADHLDEIGHLFGDNPGGQLINVNDWKYKDFWLDLVEYIRDEGY